MNTPPNEQEPLLPTATCSSDERGLSFPHRRWLAEKLESDAMHWMVLILVALDIAIVVVDLAFTLLSERCPPETGSEPKWLLTLQHVSQAITAIFLAEIPLEIYAFGWRFYDPVQAPLHAFDLLVIVSTFVLEMVLSGAEQELAGLVVILRLWRLIRLAGNVAVGVGKWQEDELDDLRREVAEKGQELEKAKKELGELRQRLGQTADAT